MGATFLIQNQNVKKSLSTPRQLFHADQSNRKVMLEAIFDSQSVVQNKFIPEKHVNKAI